LLLGARYLYVDQNSNNNFNHQMVNLKVGFSFIEPNQHITCKRARSGPFL
jgi:hypothetical protein